LFSPRRDPIASRQRAPLTVFDFPEQIRDVRVCSLPDLIPIDKNLGVDQVVAHPNDRRPGDIRMSGPEFTNIALDGFADDRSWVQNCQTGFQIVAEWFFIKTIDQRNHELGYAEKIV
jgi:hypothetical protein